MIELLEAIIDAEPVLALLAALASMAAFSWKMIGVLNRYFSERFGNRPQSPRKRIGEIESGKRELIVGVIPFPPFADYTRENGEGEVVFEGFYIDLFRFIEKQAGISVTFQPTRNDLAISRIDAGEVDLVACLLATKEREATGKRFPFAPHKVKVMGVCREGDNTLPNERALKENPSKRVAVVRGEIGEIVVKKILGISKDRIEAQEVDDVERIFDAVEKQHVDVAITDGITCLMHIRSNQDAQLKFAFGGHELEANRCGIMTGSDAKFNSWLKELIEKSYFTEEVKQREKELETSYSEVLTFL